VLDLRFATFDYEPYPTGLIKPVFDEGTYQGLVASYPAIELFKFKPALGNKYSLSEVNNPAQYERFIESTPEWKRFHAYVKSKEFVAAILEFLVSRNIDLGIRRYKVVSRKPVARRASPLSLLLRRAELSARFEFSMMGADGGNILPHTDMPQKLITLVFSMIEPGAWDTAWGGGTDVVLPKDRSRLYNHVNNRLTFEDVEVIKTWDFSPNQCLLFIKTFNSWHSVSPMRGAGSGGLRKTLTINIEAKR